MTLSSEDSSMAANAIIHHASQHYAALLAEQTAPHVLLRPRLSIDGNQWCALYGEDLQCGVAGFGDSPYKACKAFDAAWFASLEETKEPEEPSLELDVVAKVCHEVNAAYCRSIGDTSQPPWDIAFEIQRSALKGVSFLLQNPEATPKSVHDNWAKDKIADGWVYGPMKDAGAKTHPCLIPYEDLPKAQQAKDHLFVSVVRALAPYVSSP